MQSVWLWGVNCLQYSYLCAKSCLEAEVAVMVSMMPVQTLRNVVPVPARSGALGGLEYASDISLLGMNELSGVSWTLQAPIFC